MTGNLSGCADERPSRGCRPNEVSYGGAVIGALNTGQGLGPEWSGVMTLAHGLIELGWPDGTIKASLMEPLNEGTRFINYSSSGKERPFSERHRMADSALRSAHRYRRTQGPIQDRGEARRGLGASGWRQSAVTRIGRAKAGQPTLRRYARACPLQNAAVRLTLHISVEAIQEEAGISKKGAHSARKRLVARGWLTEISKGSVREAAVFRLRTPHRWTGFDGNTQTLSPWDEIERFPDSRQGMNGDPDQDAWRWAAGLGKTKEKDDNVLTSDPVATSRFAELFNVHPRTARKHLSDLRTQGLAERVSDGWILGGGSEREAAQRLGVLGVGQAHRRKNAEERRLRSEAMKAYGQRRRAEAEQARKRALERGLPDGPGAKAHEQAPPIGPFRGGGSILATGGITNASRCHQAVSSHAA